MANLGSAGIFAYNGDYVGAALSAGSAIPIVVKRLRGKGLTDFDYSRIQAYNGRIDGYQFSFTKSTSYGMTGHPVSDYVKAGLGDSVSLFGSSN